MRYSTSWVEGKKKGLGIGRDDRKLGFCNLQPAFFLASTGTEQTPTGLTGLELDYRHWTTRQDTVLLVAETRVYCILLKETDPRYFNLIIVVVCTKTRFTLSTLDSNPSRI